MYKCTKKWVSSRWTKEDTAYGAEIITLQSKLRASICTQNLSIFIYSKFYCQSILLIVGVPFETQNGGNKISRDYVSSYGPVLFWTGLHINVLVSFTYDYDREREAVGGGETPKPYKKK